MEGWIKLHRKLKDHWIWKSDNRLKWWIDILMTVNHDDAKVLIKGTLIECKRGQSVRSLDSWGRDWNVTKGAVRDFFRLLQNDAMLHTESLQITTRITVCNYEDYQTELHAEETQKKRNANAEETQRVHKQEGIRRNKNEEEISIEDQFLSSLPDGWNIIFELWLDHKKSKKQRFKDIKQLEISYHKLLKVSGGDIQAARDIIENTIAFNYSGFFELKNNQNGTIKKSSPRNLDVEGLTDAVFTAHGL